MARETFRSAVEQLKNPDTTLEAVIQQDSYFEQAVGLMLAGDYDYTDAGDLLGQAYDHVNALGVYTITLDDVIATVRHVFQKAGRESELDRMLEPGELKVLRGLYSEV